MKLNDLGKDVDCMACLANMVKGAHHVCGITHTHKGITHALATGFLFDRRALVCTMTYLVDPPHWTRVTCEFVEV